MAPRAFGSAAAEKVAKTLETEIKHEEEQYEQAKEIKAFLKKSDFKFVDTEGGAQRRWHRVVKLAPA